MNLTNGTFFNAAEDFHRARNQANLKELLSRLTGESTQLLSFSEVCEKLRLLQAGIDRGVRDIPLEAIVGSVGRYNDFTRDFLPRGEITKDRWTAIRNLADGSVGLPPIDVYQIGDVYFVKDGNHRVSVARQMGVAYIQAYVTEVHTRVPLTPDVRPDDLILKAEYASFLEHTRLDELRPGADLSVTVPGQYQVLEDHIDVHRYFMGQDYQHDVSYTEAVTHWYDTVYLPVVEMIRSQGLLLDFPERSEADLYLWIAEHRASLEEELGWQINTEYAIDHLTQEHSDAAGGLLARLGERLVNLIVPLKLESGPPTGQWRTRTLAARPDDRLFSEILVPVNGRPDGWNALEQALVIARREDGRLHGLHVLSDEEEKNSPQAQAVKEEFDRRCQEAGIQGSLALAVGEIARQISERAAWTDLVVANLAYPPDPKPLARLSSGFRDLILHTPRPILAAPQTSAPISQALLSYDGSPKAREALYVSAYLAGRWNIPLSVLCVAGEGHVTEDTLSEARQYLESHGVAASYVTKPGPVAQAVLEASQECACDLIIMGGYGYSPVLEVVLGSALDRVLRESRKPILICR